MCPSQLDEMKPLNTTDGIATGQTRKRGRPAKQAVLSLTERVLSTIDTSVTVMAPTEIYGKNPLSPTSANDTLLIGQNDTNKDFWTLEPGSTWDMSLLGFIEQYQIDPIKFLSTQEPPTYVVRPLLFLAEGRGESLEQTVFEIAQLMAHSNLAEASLWEAIDWYARTQV